MHTLEHSRFTMPPVPLSSGMLILALAGGLAISADAKLLDADTLTITGSGKLDLTNNIMVVRTTPYTDVLGYTVSGFNGGAWNGNGIQSTTAAADATLVHSVGLINNADPFAGLTDFGGATGLTSTASLLKFTYAGDADLGGTVDGTDYFLIDNGFLNNLTGWINGDFDYSGTIDGTDYFLIDNAFLNQGAPIPAAAAPVPEPGSLTLIAFVAAIAVSRRRSFGRFSGVQ